MAHGLTPPSLVESAGTGSATVHTAHAAQLRARGAPDARRGALLGRLVRVFGGGVPDADRLERVASLRRTRGYLSAANRSPASAMHEAAISSGSASAPAERIAISTPMPARFANCASTSLRATFAVSSERASARSVA